MQCVSGSDSFDELASFDWVEQTDPTPKFVHEFETAGPVACSNCVL
jgi:hypothetical protein